MSEDLAAHHELETELHRLRLLRDLHHPEFTAEAEDSVLDAMEALWYRLSAEEKRVLEAERVARQGFADLSVVRLPLKAAVDVDDDAHSRRGLPVRVAVG